MDEGPKVHPVLHRRFRGFFRSGENGGLIHDGKICGKDWEDHCWGVVTQDETRKIDLFNSMYHDVPMGTTPKNKSFWWPQEQGSLPI